VVRLGDGYTKRANSVTALDGSSALLDQKIAHCEALYRERGLTPIFRLTPYSCPAHLDGALAGCGYALLDPSRVMSLDLTGWQPSQDVPALEPLPLESWIERFHACEDGGAARLEAHRRLLQRIASPCLLAALPDEHGRSLGCGLGVLAGAYVGLYDLVISPAQRNRGHGRRLLTGMLAWAKARGAAYAFLQVMAENAAARHLYRSLGFGEAYPYWYRIAPDAET
jgi:GNAT superfamily N-acetyltransferase